MSVQTLMLDSVGILATDGEIVFYLTECCNASAKGSEFGVTCRSCHKYINSKLGIAWNTTDKLGWLLWQVYEIRASAVLNNGHISFSNVNVMKSLTDRIKSQFV